MAEQRLTDKELAFIALDCGFGCGFGSGFGYDGIEADGEGSGLGSGYGRVENYGYGDGLGVGAGKESCEGSGAGSDVIERYCCGFGCGSDAGIAVFNGANVVQIDGIPTILRNIHDNVARAEILQNDLTLTPCYVVKRDNKFAHGETIEDAMSAVMDKLFDDMSVKERIGKFLEVVKPKVKYPAQTFFDWHNRLTGSCEAGRKAFAKDHGIDLKHGEYTLEEFLALTKDAYGSGVIREVIKRLEEKQHD